jgi:uncharacterized protein YaiI (UPF0178 family)
MPRESHLNGRGEQAAVGTIVIGEELLLAAELLDRVPEILQVSGTVHVWRGLAHLRDHLREDGAAQAALSATEVDQEEDRFANRLRGLTGGN